MMPFFIYNNISSKDFEIIVNKLPPIIKATKDVELIEIPGRDGFITSDLGNYKGVIKTVECTIKNTEKIDSICRWLTGGGEVIFSNELDKKYKAVIKNQIDFSKILRRFHSFIIQFECQPHKYNVDNEIITVTTNFTNIYSNCSVISLPKVKIYGTGNLTININNKNIILNNILDYIIIDSELMDCYRETELKNNLMYGDFPELAPGINSISWTGTVNKIEITPNWRWL